MKVFRVTDECESAIILAKDPEEALKLYNEEVGDLEAKDARIYEMQEDNEIRITYDDPTEIDDARHIRIYRIKDLQRLKKARVLTATVY